MIALDPLELLFGGMVKLGPGSNADTLQALRSLPKDHFDLVVMRAAAQVGRRSFWPRRSASRSTPSTPTSRFSTSCGGAPRTPTSRRGSRHIAWT
ncbi:hypothetical protein ABIA24_006290 [Sinorhizobium fredii]|uniref:hypothetical protein n=1 Tax=Rhizobium fredii TaxID=380 RepID=UPI001FCAFE30|nr:hypothetical protein [Sinorhizobium fredii]